MKGIWKKNVGISLCLFVWLASQLKAAEVNVSWDANLETDLAGYKIYYGESSGNYSNTINAGKTIQYQVNNLKEGVKYYFAVTAYDLLNNESDFSQEASTFIPVTDITPPNPPTISGGEIQGLKVRIWWSTNTESDFSGHKVYYGTSSGQYSKTILVGNNHSYTTPDLIAGVKYFFAVTSYDTANNESAYSSEVNFAIPISDKNPPSAPVVAKVEVDQNRVHITWKNNTETDLAGYHVHFGRSSKRYEINVDAGLSTDYMTPELDQGITYFFALTAYDTADNQSAYSDEVQVLIPIIDKTPPVAPVISGYERNQNIVHINWQSNSEMDLKGYRILYGLSSGIYTQNVDVGITTQYTSPALEFGKTYFFIVTAYDTAGNISPYSNEVNVVIPALDTTPPATPVIAAYERRQNKVFINWTANTETDLSGYKVYYGKSAKNYTQIINVGKNTSYLTPELEQGYVYFFAVTAYDTSDNQSNTSNEVSVTIPIPDLTAPNAPVISEYTLIENRVQVSWQGNTEPDLRGYRFYYGKTSRNYSSTVEVGTSTSYLTPSLEEGVKYYFAVTAYDTASNQSNFSAEVSLTISQKDTVPPTPPVILTYERQESRVSLSWKTNIEPDLSGYRIYYGSNSGAYNESADVGLATSYKTRDLQQGLTYYFILTAYDTVANESDHSNEVSVFIPPTDKTPPSAPIVLAHERQGNRAYLSWRENVEPDLSGYRVHYGQIPGNYQKIIDVGKVINYLSTELEPGITYYFAVSAYDTAGNQSHYSQEVGITIPLPDKTAPSTPVITQYERQDNRIYLAWQMVVDIDLSGYRIYYGKKSQTYEQILDLGKVTSYLTSEMESGQTYYFSVTAYDTANNESQYAAEVSIHLPVPDKTPPSTPMITECERRENRVYLAWQSNTEADLSGYKIFQGKSSGNYQDVLDVGKVLNHTTSDLDPGVTYFFTITAYDTAKNQSNYSKEVSVRIPMPDNDSPSIPVIISYEREQNRVSLVWKMNNEPDLAGYKFLTGKNSGNYDQKEDVGKVTNHTTSELDRGFTYYFVVTAYDTAGNESGHSNEISVPIPVEDLVPPQAPVLSDFRLQENKAVLSWQANTESDISGYRIYYGVNSRKYDISADVGMNLSYTTKNLDEGITYYFAVTAYDTAKNESEYSMEINLIVVPVDKTPPAVPAITSYHLDQTKLVVQWIPTDGSDLAGYRFYYGKISRTYDHSIDVGNASGYTTSSLESGATYYFAVTAYDQTWNESALSEEKEITIPKETNEAPDSPVVIRADVLGRRVHLYWQGANASDLGGYRVYSGTISQNYSVVDDAKNVTDYLTMELLDGTTYYFAVTAYDSSGLESPFSNEMAVYIPVIDIVSPMIYAVEIRDSILVDLVYSEPVDQMTAEDVSNYLIDHGIRILQIALDQNQRMVHIRTSAHQVGVEYRLTVNHVRDLAENPNVIASNSTCTYVFAPEDQMAPLLVGVTVLDANHLDVLFNEAIERESAEHALNYKINQGISVLDAQLDVNPTIVHLSTTTHVSGVSYMLTVNQIKDRALVPNVLLANSTESYTYYEKDTTPPAIYSTEIRAVDLVEVLFTENVDQESAENIDNYQINQGVTVLAAILTSDLRTVELHTTSHQKDVNYIIEVSHIRDRAVPQNQIVLSSRSYYIYSPQDTQPPTLQLVQIKDANHLDLTFSEVIERESAEVEANYHIEPDIVVIEAAMDIDQMTVHLITTAHEVGTTYTITVNRIRDRAPVPNSIRENTSDMYTYWMEDRVAPIIVNVNILNSTLVEVFFSEIVERFSAETSDNYFIDNGIKITGAMLYEDLKTVRLSTTEHLPNQNYVLTVNHIKDRAYPPNTIEDNSTFSYQYVVEVNASNVLASHLSNALYQFAYLKINDAYYVDRSYTFESVPNDYDGLLWIKTANDDRYRTENSFFSFELHRKAKIYIAYDSKASSVPNWLKDNFKPTNQFIGVSGYSEQMALWERDCEKGKIQLGANLAEGSYGAESMYTVLIREVSEKDEQPSPETPQLTGDDFVLYQNYPNPFNAGTEIRYQLPENCHVVLSVYNVLGQQIRHLVRGEKQASHYVIHWDGRNSEGHILPSGVYFIRLEVVRKTTANGHQINQVVYDNVRKMLFLK